MIIKFDKTFRVGAKAVVISREDGFFPEHLNKPVVIRSINVQSDYCIGEPVHHITFGDEPDKAGNYWYCREKNMRLI